MDSPIAMPLAVSPLAGLAHELRTPLAAIVGMADAMNAEVLGPIPGPYAEYARLIRQAGMHALSVLAALSESASTTAEDRAPAAQVVRDVADAMRHALQEKHLKLDLDLSDCAAGATVPRRVLAQILFNLVGNAMKFANPGGRIRVALHQDGERLRLDVDNTVARMTPQNAVGHGLGLDIVRALCAAHGGEFRIDRAPEGASVRAWLTLVTL